MEKVVPYKNNSEGKKKQVADMFDNIAHRYDFLNHLLSLGIDKLWRKKAISLLRPEKPQMMLDVATGTGDFALAAMKLNPQHITGVDISEEMLIIGRKKIQKKGLNNKIDLISGDSEKLPFQEETFDAITVGFGVRNFENLETGLSEMRRVLKTGGCIAILEFSKPKIFPVKQVYEFYFKWVCPFVGKIFSKDNSAYSYLYESVQAFPEGNNFLKVLKKTGFQKSEIHLLTFGIATIYLAKK
jgi:demethylmenaquinone methyltransferase / 2-methoxy-6-polyprenyl-1,4-benzoquinol methylase